MSANVVNYLKPRTAQAKEKPRLAKRIAGLFDKVGELLTAQSEQPAKTYSELVTQLRDAELDKESAIPHADDILATCRIAGRSHNELLQDVEQAVSLEKRRQKAEGLPSAIEAKNTARAALDSHNATEAKRIQAIYDEGKKLELRLREANSLVGELTSLRNSVAQESGGPSDHEQAITDRIVQLQQEETRLRAQTGGQPLIDRYIVNVFEESSIYRRFQAITADYRELEEQANQGNGMSKADFSLRKLAQEKGSLEREVSSERRKYEIGSKIREIQSQRIKLSAERDELREQRLAAV